MSLEKISEKNWHEDENIWWDKYGSYMSYQWKLTPQMNEIIRADLENDYTKYLFNKDATLLDVGCGSGWLSAYFAEKGMSVYGVDISEEQINAAKELKKSQGITNVDFECCDLIKWDTKLHNQKYNCVFVNAFLHHLPESELAIIFEKIAAVIEKNGKVYLYEPLFDIEIKKYLFASFLDFSFKGLIRVIFNIVPTLFNWYSKEHKLQIKNGYTMNSPHERPISISFLKSCCNSNFEITEVKGWHLYSMGVAMQIMALKSPINNFYSLQVKFWYLIDKVMLKVFGWERFSNSNRFILCSIKLTRK